MMKQQPMVMNQARKPLLEEDTLKQDLFGKKAIWLQDLSSEAFRNKY